MEKTFVILVFGSSTKYLLQHEQIITSLAKEVMFLVALVCLFVCLFVCL